MSEEIRFSDELVRYLDADPFVPFTIVMASGDRYEVVDPHQVAIGSTAVVIFPRGQAHILLRQSQISSIEIHAPAA